MERGSGIRLKSGEEDVDSLDSSCACVLSGILGISLKRDEKQHDLEEERINELELKTLF